jgi:hypothetical protein
LTPCQCLARCLSCCMIPANNCLERSSFLDC